MEPSAKIICDSVTRDGDRLTTFEVVMHRFVLSELNTHRVFSRNSASSRAIPVSKQIERVEQNPAIPVSWPAEQKGMQGGDELDEGGRENASNVWLRARTSAVQDALALARTGVHKSVVNRILEPFMWHTVVITATAFDNFFALRCNPMAQPEIREAAEAMYDVYRHNEPTLRGEGDWHLPYVQGDELADMPLEIQLKVSAARCARVSYLTQNGVRDFEQDVQLYDRLTSADPMHASPLEHVATPASDNRHDVTIHRIGQKPLTLTLPKYGNLLGWHQLRFDVEAERDYRAFA